MIKSKTFCSLFILYSILFLLLSCSNDTSNIQRPSETSIQNPVNFIHNEQEFKIISYYETILEYVDKAKNQPDNLETLYKQSVVEPFRIEVYGEQDGFGISNLWTFIPPTDISGLEKSAHSLIENQDIINNLIKDALEKSSDKLPGGSKDVYVFPANPSNSFVMKQMKGVAGVTINKDVILILIDPIYLEEDILKYTIAHEYHHAYCMESNDIFRYNTLLDTVIVEGKADTFAEIIYPNVIVPWIEPLSEQLEYEIWSLFKDNLHSFDNSIKEDFHNGNANKRIPQWANYKIGNKILEFYIKENPSVPIETWTQIPAEEILSKSKYEGKHSVE